MAACQLIASALLALCFVLPAAVTARDSIFVESQATHTITVAEYNEMLDTVEFVNKTVPRRKAMSIGQSTGVTVTFYNQPGMDCTSGNGQCGYGNDIGGTAYGDGGPWLETSLYPYHAAFGNAYLGGCGACGELEYNGKKRSFVFTDVTNDDTLEGRPQHIDLCLPSFNYFTDQQAGDGSHGGIFSGTWTRKDCSCLGSPNYPDGAIVVRTQKYNDYAKAVVVSRVGGVGQISSINFRTRNGGFTSGLPVSGWGAWYMPTASLANQGGVNLEMTLADGSRFSTTTYPLPDFSVWETGNVFNVYENVDSSSC